MERLPRREWTKKEDTVIRKYYERKGSMFVAEKLGRGKLSIQHRALRLGVDGSKRRWNAFDIRYLKSRFGKIKTQAIARTLHRTHEAVTRKIVELKIGPQTMRIWTEKETKYLHEHYHKTLVVKIAVILKRTPDSIENKAELEGLRHRHPRLTTKQAQYVKDHFGTMTYRALALKFNVNVSTIQLLAERSGYDNGMTWRRWTPEEEALLKELWRTIPRKEVAARLNRSLPSVSVRAEDLGLTKQKRKSKTT